VLLRRAVGSVRRPCLLWASPAIERLAISFLEAAKNQIKRGTVKKIVIVAVIIALVIAFKAFGLDQYLTLAFIKESQARFAALYAQRPVTVIGSYLFLYILVTALSLPGAAIMTLTGGALFGLLTGTVVISFASTIGATLACFVSRFVLRDWVQARFGEKIRRINEGVEREGPFYLFTLRLVPVFPFWLINLVMGVTRMPLRTFYWVSQAGMLPGTVVFVNAGKELARIESLAGILSLRLILSFALLGLFPLALKKIVDHYRKRKGAHTGTT
jgi:uncharacterized membrane protein YdjX (TVP38/TMEM64 family)